MVSRDGYHDPISKGVVMDEKKVEIALDALHITSVEEANYLFYFESGLFFGCMLIGVIIGVFFWNIVFRKIG